MDEGMINICLYAKIFCKVQIVLENFFSGMSFIRKFYIWYQLHITHLPVYALNKPSKLNIMIANFQYQMKLL